MELYRCLVDEKTAKNVFSLTCQETSLPIWRRDMFTIKKYLGLQRFRILHDLLLQKKCFYSCRCTVEKMGPITCEN